MRKRFPVAQGDESGLTIAHMILGLALSVCVATLLLIVLIPRIGDGANDQPRTKSANTETSSSDSSSTAGSGTQTSSPPSADSPTTGTSDTATTAEADGASIVQRAIPAIAAYYSDHRTFDGMTAASLHSDYGVAGITVIYAHDLAYCICGFSHGPTYYYYDANWPDHNLKGKITKTLCSHE